MAYTTGQATILVNAARKRNVIYSIGYMKRHDAGVARAQSLLERLRADGSLGRIVGSRAWCLGGLTGAVADSFVMTDETRPEGLELWQDGPDWMPAALRPRYDTFLNVFSHIINLTRHMFGASPALRIDDAASSAADSMILDFADVSCVFEFANETAGRWREGLTINFERGALTVELPAPFAEEEARVTLDQGGQRSQLPHAQSWAFRRQAEAFISDIVGHSRPLASGEDSIADIALAESHWQRQLNAQS